MASKNVSTTAAKRKATKATPAPLVSTPSPTSIAPHLNTASRKVVLLKVPSSKLRIVFSSSDIKTSEPSAKASPTESASANGPSADHGEEQINEVINTDNGQLEATATGIDTATLDANNALAGIDPLKKKGIKRSAPCSNSEPKSKTKPGPKKRNKIDHGHNDLIIPRAGSKLGPKANQGAINAGLRALDRSGKPTRKWAKASYKLKSFTGEVWEIRRWRTDPRLKPEEVIQPDQAIEASTVEPGPSGEIGSNSPNLDAPKDHIITDEEVKDTAVPGPLKDGDKKLVPTTTTAAIAAAS